MHRNTMADAPTEAARPQRSITTFLTALGPAPVTYAVILAPKSINPARDEAVAVSEIRIAGKTYMRCKGLI
jgi:hypothetical protein